MDFKTLIEKLDATTYANLKKAVEIGKWPDGRALTEEQKALSLQAVIGYELEHDFPEHERTGFIDTGESACGGFGESPFQTIKWQE